MSIIEDLKWRYATKEFDASKKISPANFDILLEALTLSASSFGLQPWKFIVVENTALREKLLPHSWNQKQVIDASHLIVFTKPNKFDAADITKYIKATAETRKQNETDLEGYKGMMNGFIAKMSEAELDVWKIKQIYIALGNLLTVAANLKIDACPMEGFTPSEYDNILGLEKLGLSSVVVCPVGYRSSEDKYSTLEKIRYAKEDLIVRI